MDPKRELLRHALATIAYRGGKALRDAPENFATFSAGDGSRTPLQIVAHMGDLCEWAVSLTQGNQQWSPVAPSSWDADVARLFASLEALDAQLAGDVALACPIENLFQGPIADSLTHVGQLTLLRRLAKAPIRGENYFKADIAAGSPRR